MKSWSRVSIAAILNKHGAGELWFGVRNAGKAHAHATMMEEWGSGYQRINDACHRGC